MSVSFAFLANNVSGASVAQQDYRVQELACFRKLSPAKDASGGRIGEAAGGICRIPKPGINERGILFLIHHAMTCVGNTHQFLVKNTVLLNGQAYECLTMNRGTAKSGGHAYEAVQAVAVQVDVNRLIAAHVPAPMSGGGVVQAAFAPDQVDGAEFYNQDDDLYVYADGTTNRNRGAAPVVEAPGESPYNNVYSEMPKVSPPQDNYQNVYTEMPKVTPGGGGGKARFAALKGLFGR